MALAAFSWKTIPRAVVLGGGDLASGVILRLHRAGFHVVVLELATPLLVRRAVSFGDAVFSGERTVEGVVARSVGFYGVDAALRAGEVPVVVDPNGMAMTHLHPDVLVDARMEKRNLGITLKSAPVVIALGPGFTAGQDCHAVIETNRGHNLGRAIYAGPAEPDTGEPGSIGSQTHSRVLRAPADGFVLPQADIGDLIPEGAVIATVDGQPIRAAFTGTLRGIIHESVPVKAGMKVGDLDPRAKREHCFSISDKSLAVGGGALEAALFLLHQLK
ncbi:MAG: EF2563 family selenium-dependent molybdenum hydroxylase system protein [Pleurocapsa minor GSE-CHR-MK-17-07R]|jgi:xanthine dehydrogenase accessory factor|nr:EF2563 family selenium-dependent molybdenum hydroxylase system protein [Pleurocapsa minor GSE-CHR-MK 17-07R]